jgi:hypothetical protein
MKIIKTLCLLLLFAAPIMAQNGSVDVIYLKNGSVIRGSIFEQKPDEYIKIQSLDGNTYVYKPSEVERIAKEQNSTAVNPTTRHGAPKIQQHTQMHYQAPKKGMWFAAETQFLNPPGMGFVLGYKLHRFAYLGAGAGFNNYTGALFSNGRTFSGTIIPVYIRYSGDILRGYEKTPGDGTRGRVTPFYFVEGGYGFAWDNAPFFPSDYNASAGGADKSKGGIYASAGIGVKFRTNKNISFGLALDYKYQHASQDNLNILRDNLGNTYSQNVFSSYDMHRLGIKLIFIGYN